MKRQLKVILLIMAISLMAFPTFAQDDTGGSMNPGTITVVGTGSASGTPDIAYIELGVESRSEDIATAFSEANSTISIVISAVNGVGVASEDVRTTGLNIYREGPFDRNMGDQNVSYVVSNQIRLIVRDTSTVAEVINAAVAAGANQLYGLQFGIDNRDTLESDARADAFADARARAEELAGLAGLTVGDVVSISEYSGNASPFNVSNLAQADSMGGGGAVVEPGNLSVTVSIEVTFAIGS